MEGIDNPKSGVSDDQTKVSKVVEPIAVEQTKLLEEEEYQLLNYEQLMAMSRRTSVSLADSQEE